MDMLGDIGTVWNEMYPEEKNRLVRLLIKQTVVTETGLDLEIRTDGVKTLREEMAANAQN
jgi:site-specific DNA recombinase